jgi:Glucodextranase, domain B
MRSRMLQILRWILGFLVIAAVVGYSGFAAERVFKGPAITITSPQNGLTLDNALVQVTGRVERAASLTLNGRLIAVDTSGQFAEELLLAYGYNILELVAIDRSGKTIKKTIELFYK